MFPSASASERHSFLLAVFILSSICFSAHPCDDIYSFGSKHPASLPQRQEAAAGQEVMSTRKNAPHESLSDYLNSLTDE